MDETGRFAGKRGRFAGKTGRFVGKTGRFGVVGRSDLAFPRSDFRNPGSELAKPGWVCGHTGVGSWAHQGGFVGIPGEVSQTDLSNGLQKTLRQTSANTVNVMPFGAPADYQPLVFQEAAWSGDESSPKPRKRRVVAAPSLASESGLWVPP